MNKSTCGKNEVEQAAECGDHEKLKSLLKTKELDPIQGATKSFLGIN